MGGGERARLFLLSIFAEKQLTDGKRQDRNAEKHGRRESWPQAHLPDRFQLPAGRDKPHHPRDAQPLDHQAHLGLCPIGSRAKREHLVDTLALCLVYIGGEHFRVVESVNSKLVPGDTFQTSLFSLHNPLYLTDLRREGCQPRTYVAARRRGISELRVLIAFK